MSDLTGAGGNTPKITSQNAQQSGKTGSAGEKKSKPPELNFNKASQEGVYEAPKTDLQSIDKLDKPVVDPTLSKKTTVKPAVTQAATQQAPAKTGKAPTHSASSDSASALKAMMSAQVKAPAAKSAESTAKTQFEAKYGKIDIANISPSVLGALQQAGKNSKEFEVDGPNEFSAATGAPIEVISLAAGIDAEAKKAELKKNNPQLFNFIAELEAPGSKIAQTQFHSFGEFTEQFDGEPTTADQFAAAGLNPKLAGALAGAL